MTFNLCSVKCWREFISSHKKLNVNICYREKRNLWHHARVLALDMKSSFTDRKKKKINIFRKSSRNHLPQSQVRAETSKPLQFNKHSALVYGASADLNIRLWGTQQTAKPDERMCNKDLNARLCKIITSCILALQHLTWRWSASFINGEVED